MGDVSELYRRALKTLHRDRTMGQGIQHRKDLHNNARRNRRETEAFFRRNIDENMSPAITPAATPIIEKGPKEPKAKDVHGPPKEDGEQKEINISVVPNKRLEMLRKWKLEKEKQKAVDKAKAKPLFKVCHVQQDMVPNLENVNKTIKGKLFASSSTFKAPGNVKPLPLSRGPKLDVVSYVKTLKFETPDKKVTKSPHKKTTVADVPKNKTDDNLKKPTVVAQKSKPEPIKPKTVPKTKLVTVKSSSVRSTRSTTQKATQAAKESIAAGKPKRKTTKDGDKQVSPSSSSDAMIIINDTPDYKVKKSIRGRVVSQDNTVSTTTVCDRDQNEKKSKTPQKTVGFNVGSKTPKKSVGFDVQSSTNHTPKQAQTKKNKFRKTPLRTPNKETYSNSSVENVSYHSASDDYPIEYSESEKSLGSDKVFFTPKQKTQNEEAVHVTPKQKVQEEGGVYISPFVTISRGKHSARKEFEVRRSLGKQVNSPEDFQFINLVNKNTSPKAGAAYFTKKLDSEIVRIESMCTEWQRTLDSSEVPEEARDSVDVTIGQSRLLIAKKFQQFRGLIEECRSQVYSEKPITCEDLHGFWDMIYMQVENLDKRFNGLQTLKQNDWKEILPQKAKPAAKRPRGRPKKAQTNSKIKELIAAARNKKTTVVPEEKLLVPEEKLFEGGYFEIRSPVVTKSYTSGQRKSINRLSRLAAENSTKSRCSSSPGLYMMKVSQSIKQGGGLTPARSILKTDNSKSTGKKSVLFKEELVSINNCKTVLFSTSSDDESEATTEVKSKSPENKENLSNNLMCFSPEKPSRRRSSRLSKGKN